MTAEHRGIPVLQELQDSKYLTVNLANAIFEALISPTVEGITSAVPSSPQTGQKWIVGDAPDNSGVFGGHLNEIAIYITGGVWRFIAPENGMILYLANASFAPYRFNNNTWAEVVGADIPQSVLNRISENDAKIGVPNGLLDRVEESLVVNDFEEGGTKTIFDTCQVQGMDDRLGGGGSRAVFAISLTCIGNAPTTGTGLTDGVITLRSDTNFTWDGMPSQEDNPTPITATRAPNDGADNAMVQHWIVKDAVWDFTATVSLIRLNNPIGATNLVGSFEGTVRYNGTEVPDGGRAVVPVNMLIGEYLEENPASGASASDIETTSELVRTPVSSLPVFPAGSTTQSTWQIRNLSFPTIPTGQEPYSLEFIGQTTADDASGFVWALFYTDQNLSVSDLSTIAGQQTSGVLTDPRIIAGEEFPFGSGSNVHWTTPELQTIPNIDPTRALSLYVGNYTGSQQVTINSMEIVSSSVIEGVLVAGARAIADEQISASPQIAKIPAIETKSNNNETAISGLQTTTGELTTAQGATRTIADNNTTEIASIRALIPTDGISGVGDLTALQADVEANQGRITDAETKNMEQDSTLSELATKNTQQDEAIALNTAKIGTTPTERTRIATIPDLTNRVAANDAKPTNSQVDTRADDRIDASLAEGGAIANYVEENAGTEGALVLEDLALETTERLCGVSGADTTPSAPHAATLALECDGETPTEGTAYLGGVIRFTANSAWNGKFSIINHAFEILYKGEASFVSGGGAVEQHWRFDGVEWDFTNTSLRFMSLEITVFDGFTFTFDGELTRTTPGKAVAPVEAIVEKSIVDSLALDTGERETACTVTGTVNFSGNPQLTCSDGAPTTGIGIFGGEWRFTDTEFTWDGRFNISVSGEENQAIVATRTSPDGDSNQVWRFDGIVWNFANTFTRFIAFTGQLTPATLSGEITIPVAGEAVAPIRDIFADERANSRIERQFDPYHRGMFFKTNNYFDNDVFSRGFSYSSGATTSTTPPSVVSNPPGTAYNHAVVGAFLVSPGFNRDEDIHVRAIIRRASTASHIAIADATTAGYASGFIIPAGTGSAQVSAGLLDGTNEVLVSNPVGSSNTHTVYAIEMILRRTGGNITMDWGFNSFSSQSSAFDGNVDPYERFSSTGTITKAFPTTGLAATRWFQVSGGTIIHDLQMFTKHPE